MCKRLEIAASVFFPARDHFFDFGKIVRGGLGARSDAFDRLAYIVSGQWRCFAHVAGRQLGIATGGVNPGHVELCAGPLLFVADFTEIVERFFSIVTALGREFLA